MSWLAVGDRHLVSAQSAGLDAPRLAGRGSLIDKMASLVAIGALAFLALAIVPVALPLVLTVVVIAVGVAMRPRHWGGGWFSSSVAQPWYQGFVPQWPQQSRPWYGAASAGWGFGGGHQAGVVRFPMQWNQGNGGQQRARVIPGFG